MTLTREFVMAYLMDDLAEAMQADGYAALPSKNQFRRTSPAGFTNFIFAVSPYEDGVMVEAHMGMRLLAIEEWGQKFTRTLPGFYADAHTVILSEGKYLETPYKRHFVANTDQLAELCTDLRQFWQMRAQPFLEAHFSLKGADKLLNQAEALPSRFHPNPAHAYLKGIIAARLVHRPDFEALVHTYAQGLAKTPTGPQLAEGYDRLVRYLRGVSLN